MSRVRGAENYPQALDYVELLWRNRRKLALLSLVTGALTSVLSFLVPPTYEAVSTLIPATAPDRFSQLGQLSQLGLNMEGLGLGGTPTGGLTMMYPEIVRSRRLFESLLSDTVPTRSKDHGRRLIDILQPRGQEPKRTEIAVRKLRRLIVATLDRRTGLLTIRAKAPQPAVAAWMANSLDSLLQRFSLESAASQAGKTREFIELRLVEAESALGRAEEQLRAFRESNLRIGNSPRLLLDEGRFTRSVREREEIYITLQRQYELAKIAEHRDVPTILVLDVATEPVFRSFPRRAFMTVWGLVAGVLLGCLLVVAKGR